jgi:hypothetical protein
MHERRAATPERARARGSREWTVDDTARGLALGARLLGPGTFDRGLAAAVDALARAAFHAGLAAARLDPPIEDAQAFYRGLIQGIQEADLASRRT